MFLMDVNVLVYAHREDAANHLTYRQWLESVINGRGSFAYSELVLSGFLRITGPEITASAPFHKGIETVLNNIVEALLHTELHQTQVIVFYMMMIFILPIIYFLLRLLLRKTIRLKNDLNVLVTSYDPYQLSLYWASFSIQRKIGLFLGALSSIYLASFFFM